MKMDDELKGKVEAVELGDAELEQVNGGIILNATGLPEYVAGKPWEVIHNNTGEVLSRWATYEEARKAAEAYHSGSSYDTQICTIEQITYLRNHPQI